MPKKKNCHETRFFFALTRHSVAFNQPWRCKRQKKGDAKKSMTKKNANETKSQGWSWDLNVRNRRDLHAWHVIDDNLSSFSASSSKGKKEKMKKHSTICMSKPSDFIISFHFSSPFDLSLSVPFCFELSFLLRKQYKLNFSVTTVARGNVVDYKLENVRVKNRKEKTFRVIKLFL